MEDIKYVCPECGNESHNPGSCLKCRTPLVATCAVCGNPVVGVQIQAE